MDTFGIFGLVAFAMVFVLWSRVGRLERLLRENNIRPNGTGSPIPQLRDKVGRTVELTMYEDGGGVTTSCKILDMDEEWLHVIRNEGKKNQRELLLRLSDVKQVKG